MKTKKDRREYFKKYFRQNRNRLLKYRKELYQKNIAYRRRVYVRSTIENFIKKYEIPYDNDVKNADNPDVQHGSDD